MAQRGFITCPTDDPAGLFWGDFQRVVNSPIAVDNAAFAHQGHFRVWGEGMKVLSGCYILLLTVIAGFTSAQVDDAKLSDVNNTRDWLGYGRTHFEQRFSPLTDIHVGNVSTLGVDWYVDLPEATGLAATPLVADGKMYFITSRNVVHAVNATDGSPHWTYDPEVAKHTGNRMKASFLHGNRGVALWGDLVIFATVDGRLIALQAENGNMLWSTQTTDPEQPLYISGAPKVFKDKVLIGNGGTENGPSRGYVTAYHASTGKQAWRFYIVPGNPADGFESDAMEMAAKTWTGEWWKYGGGGNAWHGFTYDPHFDAVYIGTGNGAPWNRKIRSPGGGDNLFLCAIVALDPDTGEYKWHYQTTPGETWDYNSNMDIVLADLMIEGQPRKVILHAPKNGFFYVIDRATGRLISAEPFAEVNWASKIDLATGRPVEVPGARYETESYQVTPGPLGGHNWPPMSFNPKLGLAFIPTIHQRFRFDDTGTDLKRWQSPDWQALAPTEGLGVSNTNESQTDDVSGSLQAWDPVAQKQVWSVPLPVDWNPGTLATAGNLVFQGRADGDLVAYDARTGEVLWKEHLGLGIAAPPITYRIGDKQYIALLVGWGSIYASLGEQQAYDLGWAYGLQMRRLVAFSLEGNQVLPVQPKPAPPQITAAPFIEVNEEIARKGEDVYGQCSFCHGNAAVSGGLAPDLRASAIPLSAEAFAEVVRNGALRNRGMPSYSNFSDEHLEMLRHFIRQQANIGLGLSGASP
ncbi:MAG: PQQ-dependent dehydrogenase, methanol/ethanol family [Pseudomonadota bacterium]|nr:PQQ-dependent dehydrogenase, methanol/ethanol family [Pseudomonadota bacterium]